VALSSHELYLVLRARDEASRVLRNVGNEINHLDRQQEQMARKQIQRGAAMATIGTAVAAAGVVAIQAFSDMTDAAAAYNSAAALTLTQTDNVKTSLEELKEIGKRVAREIPAPFEQMQPALYDIFSSMDVTVKESEMLLKEFSRAAVGGNVDIQTAGRGTIGILNAWQLEAAEVHRVNDVMFQLVRKGVGTYDEFTNAIGRAVPSARRAGQQVEDLAGMMAFLTRNGLSTSMAATSAARALDAISHPNTVKKLEAMGVTVKDATGEFIPMVDIMEQLRDKLGELSAPERADVLHNLFKGSGGTIQARRFFDIAIPGFDQLNGLTDSMMDSSGALGEAYDIMFDSPQAKIQNMKNRLEVLRTEIGDQLLPAKLKLAEAVIKIIDAWESLDPNLRNGIVRFTALAAVVGTVAGVVTAAAGLWLMFAGAATLAGTSIGVVAGIVAGVVAGLMLLVVAGYLVVKNWDTIKAAAMDVFGVVREYAELAWGWMVENLGPLANKMKDDVIAAWEGLWGFLQPLLQLIWDFIKESWTDISTTFTEAYNEHIKPALENFGGALEALRVIGEWVLNQIMDEWNELVSFVQNFVWPVLKVILTTLGAVFVTVWTIASGAVKTFFNVVAPIIGMVINVISGLVKFVAAIINGEWREALNLAWQIVKDIVSGILTAFWELIKGVVGIVVDLVKNVIKFFTDLWDTLVGHSIIPDMVNAILEWIRSLKDRFLKFIFDLVFEVIMFFVRLKDDIIDIATKLGRFIQDDLPQFFRKGVDAAMRFWDDLKEKSKVPVRFVVDTVLNKGVIGGFNWIADKFGADGIKPIPMPFAVGGRVPGFDPNGSDDVLAKLTRGEFVVNAKSARQFMPLLEAINGYAEGGNVFGKAWNAVKGVGGAVKDIAVEAFDAITDPKAALTKMVEGYMGGIGNGAIGDLLKSVPKKAIDVAAEGLKKMFGFGEGSGTGSGGSANGLRSNVAAARNFIMNTFGVRNIGGYSYRNVAGTNKLSDHATGRALDVMTSNGPLGFAIAEWFLNNPGAFGTKYAIFKQQIKSVGGSWRRMADRGSPTQNHLDHVHLSYFDQGGVARGMGMMRKFTSAPERILSPQQTASFERLVDYITDNPVVSAQRGAGSDGVTQHITINTQEIDPQKHAADLGWLLAGRVG
jgi:TP901 family phage tail tape measure protein